MTVRGRWLYVMQQFEDLTGLTYSVNVLSQVEQDPCW